MQSDLSNPIINFFSRSSQVQACNHLNKPVIGFVLQKRKIRSYGLTCLYSMWQTVVTYYSQSGKKTYWLFNNVINSLSSDKYENNIDFTH